MPAPSNLGLQGGTNWLVITSSRIPGPLLNPNSNTLDNQVVVSSDLRSVSIWLVPGSGLARNELTAVTADNAPTGEPSFPNPDQYVFAPQVKDISFQFFDGVVWQQTWDGGQLGGADGNTPVGPPAAVKVTITLGGPDDAGRQYTHVVSLPTTNAFTLAAQSGTGVSETLSGQGSVLGVLSGQSEAMTGGTQATTQTSGSQQTASSQQQNSMSGTSSTNSSSSSSQAQINQMSGQLSTANLTNPPPWMLSTQSTTTSGSGSSTSGTGTSSGSTGSSSGQ